MNLITKSRAKKQIYSYKCNLLLFFYAFCYNQEILICILAVT